MQERQASTRGGDEGRPGPPVGPDARTATSSRPARGYTALRWRLAGSLLVAALLPCALLLAGGWFLFGRILETRAREMHHNLVLGRAQAVQSYLDERVHLLELVATTRSRDELRAAGALAAQLAGLNAATRGGFVDLGVIGADGSHLAYAGPYDLADRNYRDEDWFRAVRTSGVFVSDVFLGFRQVPHCVIALQVRGDDAPWCLRATISGDQLEAIVRAASAGRTGDAYLVSRDGLCQTPPARGRVLDPAPLAVLAVHPGVEDTRQRRDGLTLLVSTTWLNEDRWALVVQQDAAEVLAPVHEAVRLGSWLALGAVLVVGGVTVLATRHLVRLLERVDREREEATRAFIRSAKLASVGELATGLAHEINNPLAIISAQQTNLHDLLGKLDPALPDRDSMLQVVERCQRQVKRCGDVTGKLLQFGRSVEPRLATADIRPRLAEIVALMHKQAVIANVDLALDAPDSLAPVSLDPVELEQVLVNLVKNALDAMPGGGRVIIRARTRGEDLELVVRDNGPGVPPDVLPRLFEPFFTTKPVGQGTGLGLSVCHGIVRSWGGTIDATSESGGGLAVRIRLPLAPAPAGAVTAKGV